MTDHIRQKSKSCNAVVSYMSHRHQTINIDFSQRLQHLRRKKQPQLTSQLHHQQEYHSHVLRTILSTNNQQIWLFLTQVFKIRTRGQKITSL